MKDLLSSTVMSSLEIAELTGKRHDHVMFDIRKMLEELGNLTPDFSGVRKVRGKILLHHTLSVVQKLDFQHLTVYNSLHLRNTVAVKLQILLTVRKSRFVFVSWGYCYPSAT